MPRSRGWPDVFMALGAFFVVAAAIDFAYLVSAPFGVNVPSSWSPALLFAGGVFGLVLIGVGVWHRAHERRG